MSQLIDFSAFPVKQLLNLLLQDKTTKENILLATDNYQDISPELCEQAQIKSEWITGQLGQYIKPRAEKALDIQKDRTRAKAEVMTPSWICCKMNNHCDEEWFSRPDVFNTQHDTTWTVNTQKIEFPEGKTWQEYIDSRRIEITCGEAPYIVSRYDTTTGEMIPIESRIGLLDRKLRIVNENAADNEEWLKWCIRAFQSVYGYEWQGDNLLIARINILNTFVDYYTARFNDVPDIALARKIANIISWNFWQMDGLTGTIPYGIPESENKVFVEDNEWADIFGFGVEEEKKETPICKIWDWRGDDAISYNDLKRGK